MSDSNDALSISELERRMRPGAYSQKGFLGQKESLESVIARDNQTLKTLGVSHEQLANALEKMLQCMRDQRDKLLKENFSEYHQREGIPNFTLNDLPALERGYLVEDKFQLFIQQWRGLQNCPWGCEYDHWGSFDFMILNRRSAESVAGPGLIVHLIRKHRFFEGLTSPYRVDPSRVVRVLELTRQ